ncbi:hypothetical protein P3H15_32740 [Rhodococcus sp. T2V]|uniref:hypothetical protein n=1 Tax=Rhodococcus sp. T2V TaxID=3034164 RepID=UPI0023E2DB3C|nr:hypothetical protein [Rhodococcus sp. T2V]MDF3309788.1 hypothetical protein [Rhodococcus sp. T2V]
MSVDEHLNEAKRRLAQAAAVRRGDDPDPLHDLHTQATIIGLAQGQALVALVEVVQELAAAMAPRDFTNVPLDIMTLEQARAAADPWSNPNSSAQESADHRAEQRARARRGWWRS